MRRGLLGLALAFAFVASASAQSSSATAFEVASVKRVATPGMFTMTPPGAKIFTVRNASMKLLLCLAFDVQSNQIQSKSDWLENEYYDVSAEPEGERGLTLDELRPRLQRLFAERFKLAVHHEMKNVGGYLLTVAKSGPKLKPGLDTPAMGSIMPDGLYSASVSLKNLAAMLTSLLRQPVVDRTGITGNYAVSVKFAPQQSTDSEMPSVFTALEEQMGLKLESHAVPVDFVVVDHVEKVPVEN